ncbi:MAG: hypothetical protein ACLT3Y_07280 [Ruminococcus callidus]
MGSSKAVSRADRRGKAGGNIILFIDEVHNLVGAGNSEGSMNAANILKPALPVARSGDRCNNI